MTIFRIIEECTNNAIKHSNGSVVFFELKKITEKIPEADVFLLSSKHGHPIS